MEQDTTIKGREFSVLEFEPGDKNKEYKVGAIRDSTVYTKETDGYLPRLCYFVAWKDYLKEKNT